MRKHGLRGYRLLKHSNECEIRGQIYDAASSVPVEPNEVNTLHLDEIAVKSYVGGLVKSLERKAT